MANDIVVRVGAVLDRSFDVVLGEVEKKAERARRASMRGSGAGGVDRDAIRAAQATSLEIYRQQSKLNAAMLRERIKAESSANREATRAARQRTAEKQREINEIERAEREHQARLLRMKISSARESNAAQRKADREAYREQLRRDREVDRFATRTSHRATRFFFPPPEGAIGYAKRTALDIARGAGVDFSLSGGIGKAREREAAAVALSNQGWNPDNQAFEKRISATELRNVAKAQAARLGLKGEEDVMQAMTKFTDVTGDLETAKAIIGDIGLLARASGTDLSAAASAAADISAQLPDEMKGAERQKTMSMLMNVAAMQGKRGAVEVKDLARYVPRIAAQAGAFGAPADQTIVQLLAATQIARRYGGAGNAAQAATATSAMVNTLKTPARVAEFRKQFARAGLTGEHADIYDKKTGQLRSIPDIIKDSIVAASASKDPQIAFKRMWGNVLGAKGPEGLRNVFQKAGGGKAGLEAIDAEFKKFTAALDPEAQKKMLDEVTGTTEATANRFQQKLDEVTERMGNTLLPTLEKLAPTVLQLTDAFAKAVAWATENPGKAITAAVVASIGRAGLESGIRMLLDRAATAMLGGGVGQVAGGAIRGGAPGMIGRAGAGIGGALSGGMGTVANTLGVIGVAAASFTITSAILNSANTTVQESQTRRAVSGNAIVAGFQEEYAAAKNDEERAAVKKRAMYNVEQDEASRGPMDKLFGNSDIYFNTMKAIEETARSTDEARNRGTEQQRYEQATGQSTLASDISIAVAKELTGVMQKTLTVRVTNPDEFKFSNIVGGGTSEEPPRF